MNQAGLHLLLTRSSCGLLQAPAPSGDVLEHILQAGLRAPDHGHLQPFQFLQVRDVPWFQWQWPGFFIFRFGTSNYIN